jgi:glyoxylase-like metal-dependent hydrolase (beta-lactamase superfamily II)
MQMHIIGTHRRFLSSAKGVHMENLIFPFTVSHANCLAIRDGTEDDFDRNVLLIDMDQQLVLVDTGNGDNFDPNRGLLLERLGAVGISPADIDVVILSHADWDHIGGTVDANGTVIFPRARYVLARTEWDFWLSNPERLRPSDSYDEAFRQLAQTLPRTRLAQLRGALDLVDFGTEIVPGIQFIAAPGHTPGHTVIAVSSGDERFLFIGDLLYKPKDIENPNWYSALDFDPKQTLMTRHRIFEQASKERVLLMAYHLSFPGLGYVSPKGQGWRWQRLGAID